MVYTVTEDPLQLNFNEGVFIDHRHFDKHSIKPSYEFGYGLSYTNFSFSDLQIQKLYAGPYQPTTGYTAPAPTFGTIDYNPDDAKFPLGFNAIPYFVYPFISGPVPTGED